MGKSIDDLHKKWMKDPAYRAEYEALADEFDLAKAFIEARARAKLTQAEIAERMGTTQSAVARLESGKRLPSMRTLQRYAKATGSRIKLNLVAAE